MPRSPLRLAACAAIAAAALSGCSGSFENPNDKTVQQGDVLNASDTAVVVNAYRDLGLACEDATLPSDVRGELIAAAVITRERPDDVYEPGGTDEARRMEDEFERLVETVRGCGQDAVAREMERASRTA